MTPQVVLTTTIFLNRQNMSDLLPIEIVKIIHYYLSCLRATERYAKFIHRSKKEIALVAYSRMFHRVTILRSNDYAIRLNVRHRRFIPLPGRSIYDEMEFGERMDNWTVITHYIDGHSMTQEVYVQQLCTSMRHHSYLFQLSQIDLLLHRLRGVRFDMNKRAEWYYEM